MDNFQWFALNIGFLDFESASQLANIEMRIMRDGTTSDTDRVVTKSATHHLHPGMHNAKTFVSGLTFVTDVTEVSQKSFVRRMQLRNDLISETLITSYVKRINTDSITHKPLPLDANFREMCVNYITSLDKTQENKGTSFPYIQEKVENGTCCFTNDIVVRHSDMNFFFHTNQATYLKYCLNSASVAFDNGRLQGFDRDPCFYPCKYNESIYLQQTFASNFLTVQVFEADNRLRFKIYNHDNQLVFYSSLSFYPLS